MMATQSDPNVQSIYCIIFGAHCSVQFAHSLMSTSDPACCPVWDKMFGFEAAFATLYAIYDSPKDDILGIAYSMRISHLWKQKESFIHNDVNLSLRIRWYGFNGDVYIPYKEPPFHIRCKNEAKIQI